MKLRLLALALFFVNVLFAQSFHDTQGKLEISSSGQAIYTLPIAMPPSIGDVGPVINLVYASGQQSGIAGQGWSINSISAITRMATRYDIDGIKDGVDFDDNDKLALDGQRLLLKPGTGAYWADGSLYETEVQSNTKIELKKNGAAIYFIVTTPDGSRTWYGNYGGMNATDATAFYAVRFEDVKGNFIDYVYGKPQSKGLCVTEIRFSGNTITNPVALNKIVFSYALLARKENVFINGVKVEKAEILNKIEVFTNNALFRRYEIANSTADVVGYQRVTQIQEFNGAGESANPVKFDYKTTGTGATVVVTPYDDSVDLNLNQNPDAYGDFDGDGRLDLVDGKNVFTKLFQQGASVVYPLPAYAENTYKFAATTISNGKLNQRQSIVNVDETLNSITFKAHNLVSGSFVNTFNKTIEIDNTVHCSDSCTLLEYDENGNLLVGPGYPVSQCQNMAPKKKISTRYLEGDYNGDGISEVLVFSFLESDTYVADNSGLKTSTTKKSGESQSITDPGGGCVWVHSTSDSPVEIRLVDFNPNSSSTLGSVGNLMIPGSEAFGSGERFVADFNSDGKSDILVVNANKTYKVFGLKQLGAAPWIELELLGNGTLDAYSTTKQKLFGDYNGDGKTDVMIPDADGKGCDSCTTWHIYYSNPNPAGGSLFTKESITSTSYRPYTDNEDYTTQWHRTVYYALDINKDGKSDLVKVWMRLYMQCGTCYQDKDSEWRAYGYINTLGLNNTFTQDYVTPSEFGSLGILPDSDERNTYPIPIASNYRSGGLESDLIVVRDHDSFAKKVHFIDFNRDNSQDVLISKVTQSNGAVVDEIEYNYMVPTEGTTNDLGNQSDFYSSTESLLYPFIELKRIPGNLLVSKITNTSLGVQKFQDFRYHGYAVDLIGTGAIGFKKAARSSWYKIGDKKTWNVVEIDPSLRGATKKTYSQLLSGSFTFADATTNLLNKTENTYYPPTVDLTTKRYVQLLHKSVSTDILTNVVTEAVNDSYTTDYFLPTSVTIKKYLGSTLQATAVTTTDFEPVGATPYIGRPAKITKTVSAYGDVKNSIETITYNGANVIKNEKTGNNAPETLVEVFDYFPNGLVKSKTVSVTGTTAQTAVTPRMISYTYDATNRFVKTTTDAENFVTTNNTYHSLYGLVLSYTNQLGQTITNDYDNWGKKTKATDFLGKKITYTYTRTANVYTTTETADDGSEHMTERDALSREIRQGVKDLNGNWNYVATEYDYLGKKTKVSEPYVTAANLWTAYEYDDYQRQVKLTQPTGKVVTTVYNGLTVTVSDEVMSKSKTMNANGHVISSTDSPGGTILLKYDAAGNPIESDYGGIKSFTTYDAWGKRISFTDSSVGTYTYEYNGFGEVLKETTPKGSTTFVLNAVGKPITKTISGATAAEATSITNTYTYGDPYKRLTRIDVVNPNDGNSSYAYAYDPVTKQLNQTIETLPYATFTKNLTFDGFGRLNTEETIGTAHGKTSAKTIKYEYKNGDQWRILDGTTVIWQANTVNSRGQLTGVALGNGVNITNTFDVYGFPTQFKHEKGTTNPVNVMTLNNVFDVKQGNLTQRYTSLFDLTEKFEYDTLDRLVTWNGPNQTLLNLPFNTTTDGFTFTGTSTTGSVTNSAGTLKVVLKNPWVAAQRSLPTGFVANDIVNVKATITNKTGTTGVIVNAIMVETDPTNSGNWAEYYLGPIENGSFEKNYTVSSYVCPNPLLTIKFVVDESSPESSNGGGMVDPNSTFYVDNFKLEKASVVTQQYDDRGRITQNGTGTYTYTDTAHPYQNTGIKSMSAEDQAYFGARGNLNITYNAFKAPIQIEETGKDKLSFAYNGMLQRSAMYYGSTATDKMSRPNRRYYSADGSMEINYNNGVVELVTYVGGDAYNASIVLKSNGTTQDYYYLHRDYQGSIVAVTNATGAIVEKRHFDPWGAVVKVQDGAGNTLTKLTFSDRGYTGHEHLQSVGLIHMNGRLYDPKLHRFLQPDNYLQDPFNTQNYNRYGYVLNNPFKYTDQSGEEFICAVLIGAAVGLASYLTVTFLNHQPFTFKGALKATVLGGISGAVTFGIGQWASTITNFYAKAAMQALAHGFFQGSMSGIQGGSFWVGFASGALSSIAATAWSGGTTVETIAKTNSSMTSISLVKEFTTHQGLGSFLGMSGAGGQLVFGAIMGGAGAKLSKGNFWQGAVTGLIVTGLNHMQHLASKQLSNDFIVYDGDELIWYRGGVEFKRFPATSGAIENNINYQNSSFQNLKDLGPIPSGSYEINVSLDPSRRVTFDNISGETNEGFGIQKVPGSFTNTAGTTFGYEEGWGTLRARLEPHKGTHTFGRNNFYVHNSHKGYTHGCIEAGYGNKLFEMLVAYGKTHFSINVIVKYSSVNMSTRGFTKI